MKRRLSFDLCFDGGQGVWNWGPRDDFDEIARLVGDRDWDWEHASRQMKKVRRIHCPRTSHIELLQSLNPIMAPFLIYLLALRDTLAR